MMSSQVLRIPDHVVLRAFETETVLLNLRTSQYHGLDAIGRRMLDLLCERDEPAAVATQLSQEYDAPADVILPDVEALRSALLERGLVDDAGGGDASTP